MKRSSDTTTSGMSLPAMGEIISMTHPRAVVIFSLLTLFTAWCAEGDALTGATAAALTLAMAAIQVAVGIFNEYCDRDLDAVAKPHRAIPSGLVTPRSALTAGLLALSAGLGMAATFGLPSVLVLMLGGGMGILYSTRLKRTLLSWVPYVIAYPIVPVWVWVSLGTMRPEFMLIFPVAIPLTLGIHLCNQLRDYHDDAAQGMTGLTQFLGEQVSGRLCIALLIVGPMASLVTLHGQGGRGLLLMALAIHGVLVIRCVARQGRGVSAALWQPLFRTLQISCPLILVGWLYQLWR